MADGEFLKPVSAMLARALAEAAAGSPVPAGSTTNGSVWLVASYTAVPVSDDSNPPGDGFPPTNNGLFNIQPAYPSYQDALTRAKALGDGYGVFGPFSSTFAAARLDQPTVSTICMTTSDGGQVTIPSAGFTPPPGITPTPPEFDTLFFTADAVGKFALSYYSGIYGNGFGREVLTQFLAAPLALMGHMPWSEYTEIEEDATASSSGSGKYARGIPVILHPDGQGGYHRQPIHPGTPAAAGAA